MLALQLQAYLVVIDGVEHGLEMVLGHRVDADPPHLLEVGVGQALEEVDRPAIKVEAVGVQVPVPTAQHPPGLLREVEGALVLTADHTPVPVGGHAEHRQQLDLNHVGHHLLVNPLVNSFQGRGYLVKPGADVATIGKGMINQGEDVGGIGVLADVGNDVAVLMGLTGNVDEAQPVIGQGADVAPVGEGQDVGGQAEAPLLGPLDEEHRRADLVGQHLHQEVALPVILPVDDDPVKVGHFPGHESHLLV